MGISGYECSSGGYVNSGSIASVSGYIGTRDRQCCYGSNRSMEGKIMRTINKPVKPVKARITIKPSMLSDSIWILKNIELKTSAVICYTDLKDTDLVKYALSLKARGLTYTGNSILNCIRLN